MKMDGVERRVVREWDEVRDGRLSGKSQRVREMWCREQWRYGLRYALQNCQGKDWGGELGEEQTMFSQPVAELLI